MPTSLSFLNPSSIFCHGTSGISISLGEPVSQDPCQDVKSCFMGECSHINKLPLIQFSIHLPLDPANTSSPAPASTYWLLPQLLGDRALLLPQQEPCTSLAGLCCNLALFIGLVGQERVTASFGAWGQFPGTVASCEPLVANIPSSWRNENLHPEGDVRGIPNIHYRDKVQLCQWGRVEQGSVSNALES